MKGIAFHGIEDVRVEQFPDPEIVDPDDVIVNVKRTSICGSDLHVYYGREKGLDEGTILGHEFVGEVMEAGPASKWKVGQRVMSPFTTSCGTCYYCKIGLTSRCERGSLFGWVEQGRGLQGAQAEYVNVPLSNSTLVEIPYDLSWEDGLFLGDIFSTGFYCAEQAEIKPFGVYVVLGCGPVGLMTIAASRLLGAENVFAVDAVEQRLQKAKELGAIPILLDENVTEIIREATDGRGADAVMEGVGSYKAGRKAYDLLRAGGIISTVGVCTSNDFYFNPAEAYEKNVTFKVGRCPARYYMDKLIPVLQEGKVSPDSIITQRMSLTEGRKAYDIFANKKEGCLKIILLPS